MSENVQNTETKAVPVTTIMGLKSGQTHVYNEKGDMIPVTVIDLKTNFVTQVKTTEKDSYNAIQVGMMPKKRQRVTKPVLGHFKASGNPGYYFVQEIRMDTLPDVKAGDTLACGFKVGDKVDVSGISKGKGFQGVMKRWNFAGGRDSHGHSISHRSPGSIGFRTDPGKVFKGKKMAGHMGCDNVTVQNLEVIEINLEDGYMLIRGAVPGHKNGMVEIHSSVKRGKK